MQLLDVACQPAELCDETREERVPETGLLVHELFEVAAAEDQRLCRFERDSSCRTGRSVEQRKLAEKIAAQEGRDDGALLAFR